MPFLAFFSKRLYRDVGRNWKGANLSYLFLLLAVCCVPATLKMRGSVLKSLETSQVEILNQIPEITIRNGAASTEAPQPYYINNREGDPIAIIDTTGSMNYIDDASVLALLTENKLIIRRGKNLFNTFDLAGIEEFHLDRFIINGWLAQIKAAIAPLSYGIFLMLSYIFAVMTMLLMAVGGLILSVLMKGHLKFSETLRIATVAATPAIIFITISAALGNEIPSEIYLGVTLLYLFVGLKVCAGSSGAEEDHIDLKAVLQDEERSLADAA